MPIELTPIPADDAPEGGVRISVTRAGSGLPVAAALVWVTSDAAGNDTVDGPSLTDTFGIVRFSLADGGSYFIWLKKNTEQPIKGVAFTASETEGNAFQTAASTAPGAASSLATALLARVKAELRVVDDDEDDRLLRLIDEGIAALQDFRTKTIVETITDPETQATLSLMQIRYVVVYVAQQFEGDESFGEALSAILEQVRDK